MELTEEQVLGHYLATFDERTRAAHLATLAFAAATEPTGWPTVPMVRRFARLFEVPMVELGAWFGLMCRIERRKELWVDLFRNGPGTHDAKRLMTRKQSRAFGTMLAMLEVA